jgi:penicillin-binding protein 1C
MIATFAVVIVFVIALSLSFVFTPTPSLYGEKTFSSAVYDRHGELLRLTLAQDQRYRLFTPLAGIEPIAIEATLLYEDRWFRYHPGINPVALVRAGWQTFVTRQRSVGASTISMQLARMRFAIDSSSIRGKLVQIYRALQLEWHYSKSEILEAYLNLAPYGGNIEGLGTASLIYFNKNANALTLIEALSLIVIPQNPIARVPTHSSINDRDENAANSNTQKDNIALHARQRAFALWLNQHPDDAHWGEQMKLPLHARRREQLPFSAPHFVDHLLIEKGPGSWHSSLDKSLQQQIEQQIADYVLNRKADGIDNAAAILIDTRDTSVAAWAGSANWFNDSIHGQVDGVTAKRSPGSTLKPFIYAQALEQGLIHPQSLLADLPTRFGAYTPENFDRGYFGPVSAQDALIDSRNVPAVTLASQLNPDFHTFLNKAGITSLREPNFYGLAIALGGVEVTMLELSALYASLANGGERYPIALTLDDAAPRPGTRLLSKEAAFITLAMLAENPRPFSSRHSLYQGNFYQDNTERNAVAWKTGTSWAFRDAWSVGLFGHYLVAVWVGNFDGSGNSAFVGNSAAAPLLFRIIDQLNATPHGGQATPSARTLRGSRRGDLNVKKILVCAASGDLPNQHCPKTKSTWYIPGVSPIRVSSVHQPVQIDANGFRSCHPNNPSNTTTVMEFWPSDFLALFKLAGLPHKQPPAYAADCALSDIDQQGSDQQGIAPRIKSPSSGVEYTLRASQGAENKIPLQAAIDAGARTVFWFADDRFIASANGNEIVEWSPRPGRYIVRAVDDLGHSDTVKVTVRLLPEG